MLYLAEADVRRLLTMPDALAAVEAGFRKLALDEAENRPRQRVQTDQVMLHVLPAVAKTLGAVGFKAYTTGKFGARFHVTLFDPKTGAMTALVEADHLGRVRTGAASGVATRLLARPDASTLGLYGAGGQARTQLEAVCAVRPIKRVYVYSRDAAKRAAFAAETSAACNTEVVPVDTPEEAARGMDVVCTATTSRDPVLKGDWLADGCHVNLVGSNFLAKSEADVGVFRRASLVTADSVEQARLEAGDFVAPIREGALTWGGVRELAQVLIGRYPGRQSPAEVTVFKSLGLGLEDIAVAVRVLELARAQGVGRELALGEPGA
jgi:ornithine cyclodeaminase/alanine dehydrogenase-like protein (mu-crystallin family)